MTLQQFLFVNISVLFHIRTWRRTSDLMEKEENVSRFTYEDNGGWWNELNHRNENWKDVLISLFWSQTWAHAFVQLINWLLCTQHALASTDASRRRTCWERPSFQNIKCSWKAIETNKLKLIVSRMTSALSCSERDIRSKFESIGGFDWVNVSSGDVYRCALLRQ